MKLSPALRKAAVLISSLDARSVDALLDQMGEAQARQVRAAVMEVGDISAAEQERVMAEFLGGPVQGTTANFDDGVELSGSLASALQSSATKTIPVRQPITTNRPPTIAFGFLEDASSEIVAKHLLREQPQIIAVVLAHLPSARAAELVIRFPAELQAEVLQRVGEIEEMDREVVREVERGLEAVLARDLQLSRRRGAGVATLQAILNASGDARTQLVQGVAQRDKRLAAQVQPKTTTTTMPRRRVEVFATPVIQPAIRSSVSLPQHAEVAPAAAVQFSQLAQLDDRAWARILGAADAQVSLLALAGATPELVERLLRQLPPADARTLQRKMEQLGAVRLRDIDRAQEQLARIAGQLAARGEIRLPRQRPFATAA